jgi:hypothetical protein
VPTPASRSGGDERRRVGFPELGLGAVPRRPRTVNSDGPDLLEMFFVALVLVAIVYSFTH